MKLYSCSYEHKVESTVREGRWPDACEPELREHVKSCSHCQDLVIVSTTLQRSRQQAMPTANLVSPGLLWWRAQIRQRNAAIERAARPVALMELFAITGILFLAAALAVVNRGELLDWMGRVTTASGASLVGIGGLWPAEFNLSFWLLLIAAASSFVLLGGLAVYLTARGE